MKSPQIEILGVYKLPFTEDLYKKAYDSKYEGIFVPFWTKWGIRKSLKEELSSIAVIEVNVKNPDNNFDVGDFKQPDSDQAPYDEVFLNPEGTEIISKQIPVPFQITNCI